jgi:hypothetical protein
MPWFTSSVSLSRQPHSAAMCTRQAASDWPANRQSAATAGLICSARLVIQIAVLGGTATVECLRHPSSITGIHSAGGILTSCPHGRRAARVAVHSLPRVYMMPYLSATTHGPARLISTVPYILSLSIAQAAAPPMLAPAFNLWVGNCNKPVVHRYKSCSTLVLAYNLPPHLQPAPVTQAANTYPPPPPGRELTSRPDTSIVQHCQHQQSASCAAER